MDWFKPYTDPLSNQNLCNSKCDKEFFVRASWHNFMEFPGVKLRWNFQVVDSKFFCPIVQLPCLDFFWNSPISPFCLKFPRVKVTNLKIIGIFFKKVCPWLSSFTLFRFLMEWVIPEKKNRRLEDMLNAPFILTVEFTQDQ